MSPYLSPKAERETEELFRLKREALQILVRVVDEWEHDPMSVQCFDLRMVSRAKEVIERIKKLDVLGIEA